MQTRTRAYALMAAPAVLLFFFFHTFPALQGLFYSFTDYKGYGDFGFAGIRNYVNVFKDSRVWNAYGFTALFAVVSTLLVNAISLFIALGLNSRIHLRGFLKAIYFLPNVLSILIVSYIFNYFFAHILPVVGRDLGVEALSRNILGNPSLAWFGVVIVAVWQASAFNIILYLAGLQTIPQELYEACTIDGASSWQSFTKVTFPLIAPFFTINMVLAMKNFLMVFDHIIALTGGGPGRATESVSIHIYRGGFLGSDFAYQSANSIIYFVVIAAISILQLRMLQRREVEL